jgi:hypothetical protein
MTVVMEATSLGGGSSRLPEEEKREEHDIEGEGLQQLQHLESVEIGGESGAAIGGENRDHHENGDTAEKGKEEQEKGKKKKRHMKVAADAPWKDRMWEGASDCG